MMRTMSKLLTSWAAALLLAAPAAQAALAVGAAAPSFTVEAATGGKAHPFDLAEALKRGPVVVYFYPKAFTSGCTLEAKQFADAMPQFQAAGVSVIGLSTDDIPTLKRFSEEACRSAFPVGADANGAVMRAYDARLAVLPNTADRISYLVTPDGRVAAVHEAMAASGHVPAMLKAAQGWRASQPSRP